VPRVVAEPGHRGELAGTHHQQRLVPPADVPGHSGQRITQRGRHPRHDHRVDTEIGHHGVEAGQERVVSHHGAGVDRVAHTALSGQQ